MNHGSVRLHGHSQIPDHPLRPTGPCPKCGMDGMDGFAECFPRFGYVAMEWDGPVGGRLEWPCRTCGYRVHTKTMDAG